MAKACRGGRVQAWTCRARPGEHGAAENQQHQPPAKVDVDVERALVHFGVRTGHRAVDGQQRADEGEHEANRPANIETHKFLFLSFSYQKITLRMTQHSSRMIAQHGRAADTRTCSSSLSLGVSE